MRLGKFGDMRTGVEVLGVVSQRLDELKNSRRGSSTHSENTRCIAKRDYKRDYCLVDVRLQSIELSLALGIPN